ncbi:MAG: 23S rRNA (uracil(1939)-C(5))-methyltransferase RlmD [Oscillospiraceae bacterium]|nr:23S rRNA (uracil(1939)-C(5))-methyltransferase RlmD [Oscillospiraceae bacterium]
MIAKKNQICEIEITDLTDDGQGIGKIDGFAVFCEGLIPGDRAEIKIVKANKNYAYGEIARITEASIHRIKPKCKYFKNCGGCALQNMDYAAQLGHKAKTVKNCLERIGGFKNAGEITKETVGMECPYNYRNKAQFPVKKNARGGADIGFYSKRSHEIINVGHCGILHQANDKIIGIFKQFINKNIKKFPPYDETKHEGLIRHIFTRVGFYSGEIMVCIVINGDDLPNCGELGGLIGELSEIQGMKSIALCPNKNKTNVILGEKAKTLWGADYIFDYIGDKKFKISANSFYQVNPEQTKKLYDKIIEYAKPNSGTACADAYCGIGAISIALAPFVKKVYGVEIIGQAVSDARENAKINNIGNIEFIEGKSEEIIPKLISGGEKIDLIVVDPPRKGCDAKLIESIAKSRIRKLVYVSCDPATQARDLKLLAEYELISVQPVDMFPQTMHVESVALLTRKANF